MKDKLKVTSSNLGEEVKYCGENVRHRGKYFILVSITDNKAICRWGSEVQQFNINEIKLIFTSKIIQLCAVLIQIMQ